MYRVSLEQRRAFDRLPVGKRKSIKKYYGSVSAAFEAGMTIKGRRAIQPLNHLNGGGDKYIQSLYHMLEGSDSAPCTESQLEDEVNNGSGVPWLA